MEQKGEALKRKLAEAEVATGDDTGNTYTISDTELTSQYALMECCGNAAAAAGAHTAGNNPTVTAAGAENGAAVLGTSEVLNGIAAVDQNTILNLEMVPPPQVLRNRQMLKRQREEYNKLVLAQQGDIAFTGGSEEKMQEELNEFDERMAAREIQNIVEDWQQLQTDPETKELLEVLFSDETEIPHHSSGLDSDVYQKSVMSAGEVSTELGFEVDDGNVYYMAHE